MFCSRCGKAIDKDSRFCRHCGAPQQRDPAVAVDRTGATSSPTGARAQVADAPGAGGWVPWAVGGGILLFLIVVLASLDPGRPTDSSSDNLVDANLVMDPTMDLLDNSLDAADPAAPAAGWTYSEDVDKVRGARSYYATTTSTNTIHQNPPYDSETSMSLTVRKSPAHGTDVLLTISSGQMMCPSYDGCSGTVSFDGGPPQHIGFNGPADHSSETIFVEDASSFITKLKKAKKLVIEKTLYEAGNPQFEFDVAGLKWDR